MSNFEDVATVRITGSDIAAVITKRTGLSGEPIITFRLVKEFERGKGPEMTSFLNVRHLETIPDLLEAVDLRIRQELSGL